MWASWRRWSHGSLWMPNNFRAWDTSCHTSVEIPRPLLQCQQFSDLISDLRISTHLVERGKKKQNSMTPESMSPSASRKVITLSTVLICGLILSAVIWHASKVIQIIMWTVICVRGTVFWFSDSWLTAGGKLNLFRCCFHCRAQTSQLSSKLKENK